MKTAQSGVKQAVGSADGCDDVILVHDSNAETQSSSTSRTSNGGGSTSSSVPEPSKAKKPTATAAKLSSLKATKPVSCYLNVI